MSRDVESTVEASAHARTSSLGTHPGMSIHIPSMSNPQDLEFPTISGRA
jgi:hypothetical protein